MAQLPKGVDLGLFVWKSSWKILNWKMGKHWIDLGCGTGKDLFLTRIKYPDSGTLYGLDRLDEMIFEGRRKKPRGYGRNLKTFEFRQGTLTSMPFEPESMDKAISNCVINHCSRKNSLYIMNFTGYWKKEEGSIFQILCLKRNCRKNGKIWENA